MKKLLLASVAISGLALASAPAHADVDLEVGGYFKGYGVFLDTDTANSKDFDFIRETELHIGGETTLDNGLTVGAHFELEADGGDGMEVEESYVYFSGDWGRVNFGAEDGAAYLLQVSAPSADSNIDGLRNYVAPSTLFAVDYDSDLTGKADKLTYLSPVFSGFQAGVTIAPDASGYAGTSSIGSEGTTTDMGYEVAVRYEGQFQNVGVIAGAGYGIVTNDVAGGEDADSINVALDLDIAAFGIGAAYLGETDTSDVDTDTIVVGVDYTTGAFKLGASYLNQEVDNGTETDRYTGGVVYNYGPGMSFRGSISYAEEDTADVDETAVILGTQVNF